MRLGAVSVTNISSVTEQVVIYAGNLMRVYVLTIEVGYSVFPVSEIDYVRFWVRPWLQGDAVTRITISCIEEMKAQCVAREDTPTLELRQCTDRDTWRTAEDITEATRTMKLSYHPSAILGQLLLNPDASTMKKDTSSQLPMPS